MPKIFKESNYQISDIYKDSITDGDIHIFRSTNSLEKITILSISDINLDDVTPLSPETVKGSGANFNITRIGTAYEIEKSPSKTVRGQNYTVGTTLKILGSKLGGADGSNDLTLVVTLEPCVMCAGAIAQSRMKRLVFGAFDEKAGAVGSIWDVIRDPRALTKVEVVSGVLADECAVLLKDFFNKKR